jgi:hypothetical protein
MKKDIEHWSDKNLLYSNWIGSYLSVEQVKAGALLGLEKIKEMKVAQLLNDNRQLEGVWNQANDWVASYWMPEAIKAGLRKFAHIIPQELYAQLSAELMEDNAAKQEGEFQLKLFDNQEDAEEWLLKS